MSANNLKSPHSPRPFRYLYFGAGRWIIYSTGFILFCTISIFLLLSVAKDVNNFSNYVPIKVSVGYKEGACSDGSGSKFRTGYIPRYNYSATDDNNNGYIIKCSDRDLVAGSQVIVYVLPNSKDVFISKGSLISNIEEEILILIPMLLVTGYLFYSLSKHKIKIFI